MISVFTALHPPTLPYLSESYVSLLRQTHEDWEWIIACNGGAVVPPAIRREDRVRILHVDGGQSLAKATACHHCSGSVIVKLDADDLLSDDALETVAETTGFAYGNTAPFMDCTWDPVRYASNCGWQHRQVRYSNWQGSHRAMEHISWPPGPLMMASLHFGPVCLMAWERETYRRIGGYEVDSAITPEHELLCKTYLECGDDGIRWHDKCLSFYRQQKQGVGSKPEVKIKQQVVYRGFILSMYRRWCEDQSLLDIDLDAAWGNIALGNGVAGVIRSKKDDLPWDEIYRVIAPGGAVFVDHEIEAHDQRFQRFHKSAEGTHFISLKGNYARRPIGAAAVPR